MEQMNQLTKTGTSVLPMVGETLGNVVTSEIATSLKNPAVPRHIFGSDFLDRVEEDHNTGDSLFEHFAWLYILCREKLFRDDTERIIRALWPNGEPAAGARLVEFGCGPGFYSSRLAARFPQLSVLGIDSSESQLHCARSKARSRDLNNCAFQKLDVLALSCDDRAFDAVIASRLFTILPQRERAIAEMFRILRPGGRCFVAEPRRALRASIPLFSMWLLASVTHFKNGYREPATATVLSTESFQGLFRTQPWRKISIWRDRRYQYALCEKD